MYKKFVFASMVGALTLSTSGLAYAMDEGENKKSPPTQQAVSLSAESNDDKTDKALSRSELVDSIYDACVSTSRIEYLFKVTEVNANKKEEILGKLRRSISEHFDYGFSRNFIEKLFNSNDFWAGAGEVCFSYNAARSFAIEILSLKIEEATLNTQIRDFRGKLAAFYEKCDGLENQKVRVTYENHFGTFFRFIEGMSEEQQASATSLLSPHLNRRNFSNFYPYQLLEGLDTYDVGDLNGVRKIEWLQAKLESAGYFPETK